MAPACNVTLQLSLKNRCESRPKGLGARTRAHVPELVRQDGLVIFAKAAANITDCSIPAINQILLNLFPSRGNCYVVDGPNQAETQAFGFGEATDRVGFGQGPFVDYIAETAAAMTMVYVFDFALRPYEISIVLSSGVLPKPTGVKATASYLGVLLT